MTAWYDVRVEDPQRLIDTFGAGALLRVETSDDDGTTWVERTTEVLVATKRLHTIEYPAGDDDTLFRHRFSTADPLTDADRSAYSDVRPVTASALVVTAGSASANSYLTVAAADVLAADDIGPEADTWLAAATRDKAAALKRATREIDAYVASGWPPYDPDQALTFPRETMDVDDAGTASIPRKVQLATYQQAIFVLSNKDELAVANGQRWREGRDETEDAFGAGPIPVGEPCRLARHYLAGFRTAPKAGRGGGIGSARVASGFSGTW